jgi:single-strand DNA-binding protein
MTTLAMTEAPTPQFQVITLTGRLTTDPELRSTTNGSVASLRLAIQRPRKDGEDQGADYVDITVFGRQADTVAQYLAKGRKVAIEGRLHHSEWDSDNGRRQKLEVIARNVEFLDRRKTNDNDDNGSVAEEEANTSAAI